MSTAEVERFLGTHAPFASLDPELRREVAGGIRVRFFPAGETILHQRGQPSRFTQVVRTGSVELVDDDRVVDVLDEGELFGHPSLLSGIEPVYGARAREDTICYVLAEEIVERVFGNPTGIGYLAASLRRRLAVGERAGELRSADPRLTRVDALVRTPLECDGDEPIHLIATRMAERGASAAIVRTRGGHGIITDADLRSKVVAAGVPGDRPVSEVMSFPLRSVPGDRLVRDAILDMLDAGTRHLGVHDDRGRVLGLLSELDLLGVERRDPFEIRAEIDRAADPGLVAAACGRLPRAVAELAEAGLDSEDVARVVATIIDAATARLLAIAVDELGASPAPWAWLALGSQGRREQALATDQDHALVWSSGDDADPWFGQLATAVTSGLERCGIPPCPSQVMATAPTWRGPIGAFTASFRERIEAPASRPVFATAIAFDHRVVAGPFDPTDDLLELQATARRSPAFLWRLTRLAIEARPPLGFRGDVVVGRIGEEEGVLDVKAGGLLPVTDLARIHAIRAGITATSTIERLRGAATAGAIAPDTADALAEAFHVFLDVRLDHQAAQVTRGEPPDNLIDPSRLGRIDRGRLRDAFRIVAGVQRDLSRGVSGSRFG